MKKSVIILIPVIICIALIPFLGINIYVKAETEAQRLRCIRQFGWDTADTALEEVPITIPEPLDPIYREYNTLQKEIGLDISRYCGEEAVRYTYTVLNHPEANGRQVRANIIVCRGEMIAGDIMVTALDGFIHSLKGSNYK